MITPALAWEQDRGRLIAIAYRMLGDMGEAEDVTSEVAESALIAKCDPADLSSGQAHPGLIARARSPVAGKVGVDAGCRARHG